MYAAKPVQLATSLVHAVTAQPPEHRQPEDKRKGLPIMAVKPRTKPESATSRALRLYNGDFTGTARRLLEELMADDESGEAAIAVLLTWVTNGVRSAIRTSIRQAEEAAWESPSGTPRRTGITAIRSQTGPLPSLDNLEYLLSLPVVVPALPPNRGTRAVAWRDMTIDDHRARIGLLRRPQTEIDKTIGRHEWSIEEIRRRGVTCLGDIPVVELERDLNAA
jgi:hypothetical protein